MNRSGLHPKLKDRLRLKLLALDVSSHVSPTLARFGLERFAPVTYEHYAPKCKPCENASARWVPACAEP